MNAPELAQYIREELRRVCVEVRRDIVLRSMENPGENPEGSLGTIARAFAQAKIFDPRKHREDRAPLPGEIRYEEKRLRNITSTTFGNIYDGLIVQDTLKTLIPQEELSLHRIHIVITNQLLATWDEEDLRYHIRASIYGIPNMISTTGIVEAPARPREFYLLKQGAGPGGWDSAAEAQAAEAFKDRMVLHDDPRLTEVMKGYVMQALFYHLTGDPFCSDVNCRLFNAHWQEELLRAQITSTEELCPGHQAALEELRTSLSLSSALGGERGRVRGT